MQASLNRRVLSFDLKMVTLVCFEFQAAVHSTETGPRTGKGAIIKGLKVSSLDPKEALIAGTQLMTFDTVLIKTLLPANITTIVLILLLFAYFPFFV